MAAYGRVYDSRQLQADCQASGSASGPYDLFTNNREMEQ